MNKVQIQIFLFLCHFTVAAPWLLLPLPDDSEERGGLNARPTFSSRVRRYDDLFLHEIIIVIFFIAHGSFLSVFISHTTIYHMRSVLNCD